MLDLSCLGYEHKDFIKNNIQGRKWDGRRWLAPDTIHNELLLAHILGKSLYPPHAEPTHAESTHAEPINLKYAESILAVDFFEHQKTLTEFALKTRTVLIGAEPRTGKTNIALAVGLILNEPILWFAPKQPILDLEVKYRHLPVHFISYSEADKFYPLVSKYKVVVLDELHNLKTEDSKRSEVFNNLYEDMYKAHGKHNFYIIGLTGTPTPLNPLDLWNQAEIILPGFIRFKDQNTMRDYVAETQLIDTENGQPLNGREPIGRAVIQIVDFIEERVAEVASALSPMMRCVRKADVFNLPPVEVEYIQLEADSTLQRNARILRRSCETVSKLTQALRRLSDGVIYLDSYDEVKDRKNREIRQLANPKKNWIRDTYVPEVLQSETGRGLVFAGFVGSVEGVALTIAEATQNLFPPVEVIRVNGLGWFKVTSGRNKKLNNEEIKYILSQFDRSRTDEWDNKKYFMVGHPKSLATGLELSAVDHLVWYSGVDDGEAFAQAKERPYSFNRGQTVLKMSFLCLLPSDKIIYERLEKKESLQSITFKELAL